MGASGANGGSRSSWPGPVGPGILIPGYPQWAWCQTERGAVLFGSYASSLAVGLFAWGTPVGYAFVLLALAAHAASAADAVRQSAFPGFGRWVPLSSASAGVGLFYAPVLLVSWALAWPVERDASSREGFLVNRWAFRDSAPEIGDWVWFDRGDGETRGAGRLWAKSGDEVEWIDGQLRIAGEWVDWRPPTLWQPVRHLLLKVPEGHVLIEPLRHPGGSGPEWVLVEGGQVQGRAWAQHSPIWARRLLR